MRWVLRMSASLMTSKTWRSYNNRPTDANVARASNKKRLGLADNTDDSQQRGQNFFSDPSNHGNLGMIAPCANQHEECRDRLEGGFFVGNTSFGQSSAKEKKKCSAF